MYFLCADEPYCGQLANLLVNPSYIRNIIALLGIALATVTPHPAYSPFKPCILYISLRVPKNVGFAPPGLSSAAVCIVLFTLSAGKSATLYATPAHAPETADSQGRRLMGSPSSACRRRRARRKRAAASLDTNQAAPPPSSRMKVPVCPSQRPKKPVWRIVVMRTEIGPGRCLKELGPDSVAAGADDDAPRTTDSGTASICTCILHLTSSIGVLYFMKYCASEPTTPCSYKLCADAQKETCDGTCT